MRICEVSTTDVAGWQEVTCLSAALLVSKDIPLHSSTPSKSPNENHQTTQGKHCCIVRSKVTLSNVGVVRDHDNYHGKVV